MQIVHFKHHTQISLAKADWQERSKYEREFLMRQASFADLRGLRVVFCFVADVWEKVRHFFPELAGVTPVVNEKL